MPQMGNIFQITNIHFNECMCILRVLIGDNANVASGLGPETIESNACTRSIIYRNGCLLLLFHDVFRSIKQAYYKKQIKYKNDANKE
jgi:hypothetical protein